MKYIFLLSVIHHAKQIIFYTFVVPSKCICCCFKEKKLLKRRIYNCLALAGVGMPRLFFC